MAFEMSQRGQEATPRSTRDISPPPSKRRQTDGTSTGAATSYGGKTASRIFSWNVNGIEPLIQKPITSFFNGSSKIDLPLRGLLRRHGWPEVLCLQEVKIKPTDMSTQRAVEIAANRFPGSDNGPNYIVRFCLPRDKFNAGAFGGKLYGVATFIREDVWPDVERCREVGWDREGRVLILETKSRLAIFNIYAVNGTRNPYKDPETGLPIGTRHDRKLQFHSHLLRECLELKKAGFHLILAGDMNIAREALDGYPSLRTEPYQHVLNRTDFNEKFFTAADGLQAIDTFRHVHGSQRKFTYFPRNAVWASSCDRVDLIVISKELAEVPGLLLEADILDSPQERSTSDHVPLFVALGKEKLDTTLLGMRQSLEKGAEDVHVSAS